MRLPRFPIRYLSLGFSLFSVHETRRFPAGTVSRTDRNWLLIDSVGSEVGRKFVGDKLISLSLSLFLGII